MEKKEIYNELYELYEEANSRLSNLEMACIGPNSTVPQEKKQLENLVFDTIKQLTSELLKSKNLNEIKDIIFNENLKKQSLIFYHVMNGFLQACKENGKTLQDTKLVTNDLLGQYTGKIDTIIEILVYNYLSEDNLSEIQNIVIKAINENPSKIINVVRMLTYNDDIENISKIILPIIDEYPDKFEDLIKELSKSWNFNEIRSDYINIITEHHLLTKNAEERKTIIISLMTEENKLYFQAISNAYFNVCLEKDKEQEILVDIIDKGCKRPPVNTIDLERVKDVFNGFIEAFVLLENSIEDFVLLENSIEAFVLLENSIEDLEQITKDVPNKLKCSDYMSGKLNEVIKEEIQLFKQEIKSKEKKEELIKKKERLEQLIKEKEELKNSDTTSKLYELYEEANSRLSNLEMACIGPNSTVPQEKKQLENLVFDTIKQLTSELLKSKNLNEIKDIIFNENLKKQSLIFYHVMNGFLQACKENGKTLQDTKLVTNDLLGQYTGKIDTIIEILVYNYLSEDNLSEIQNIVIKAINENPSKIINVVRMLTYNDDIENISKIILPIIDEYPDKFEDLIKELSKSWNFNEIRSDYINIITEHHLLTKNAEERKTIIISLMTEENKLYFQAISNAYFNVCLEKDKEQEILVDIIDKGCKRPPVNTIDLERVKDVFNGFIEAFVLLENSIEDFVLLENSIEAFVLLENSIEDLEQITKDVPNKLKCSDYMSGKLNEVIKEEIQLFKQEIKSKEKKEELIKKKERLEQLIKEKEKQEQLIKEKEEQLLKEKQEQLIKEKEELKKSDITSIILNEFFENNEVKDKETIKQRVKNYKQLKQKFQKTKQPKNIKKETTAYKPNFGRGKPVDNFTYYQDPKSDKNTILSFDIKNNSGKNFSFQINLLNVHWTDINYGYLKDLEKRIQKNGFDKAFENTTIKIKTEELKDYIDLKNSFHKTMINQLFCSKNMCINK